MNGFQKPVQFTTIYCARARQFGTNVYMIDLVTDVFKSLTKILDFLHVITFICFSVYLSMPRFSDNQRHEVRGIVAEGFPDLKLPNE